MENSLVDLRAQRGWSQQRLADELGVSRQTVISVERGRHDPSLALAFAMARLFACQIEDIFRPQPPSTPPDASS